MRHMNTDEHFKSFIVVIFSYFVAVLGPLNTVFAILAFGFTTNFVTGLYADVRINKAHFSMKKAVDAVALLFYYFGIVFFVHFTLTGLHMNKLAEDILKWLTILLNYFYLVNTVRNGKLIWPKSKALVFIYSVLSTEVFSLLHDIVGLRFNKIKNNINNEDNEKS